MGVNASPESETCDEASKNIFVGAPFLAFSVLLPGIVIAIRQVEKLGLAPETPKLAVRRMTLDSMKHRRSVSVLPSGHLLVAGVEQKRRGSFVARSIGTPKVQAEPRMIAVAEESA